jgi:hypothetical protein
VLGVIGRDAHRLIDDGQLFRVLFFRFLNAALDIANRVEILSELDAIFRAEPLVEPRDFPGHVIQDAVVLPDAGEPLPHR